MDQTKKICPHCREPVNALANKCPHCQSDLRNWPRRHPMLLTLFGIAAIAIVLIVIGSVFPSQSYNPAFGTPTAWYYVNASLQCVQAPGMYQDEGSCQNAVGSTCFEDATCAGENQTATLYYINASNQCVVAPGNPYSVVDQSDQMTAGILGEEENCQQAIGQPCFADSTCGGAGTPGFITLQGAAYKLATLDDLEQHMTDPGFFNNTTSTASLVAVEGTVETISPANNGTDYYYVLDAADGPIIAILGTINVNTKQSNGFDPNAFPVGTKVVVGGAFLGQNFTLAVFKGDPSYDPQGDTKLLTLGLPSDTPIISSESGVMEQASQ